MEHSVLTRCHGHNGQGWGQCQESQGAETWEQSHHKKKINWSRCFQRPFGPMCNADNAEEDGGRVQLHHNGQQDIRKDLFCGQFAPSWPVSAMFSA